MGCLSFTLPGCFKKKPPQRSRKPTIGKAYAVMELYFTFGVLINAVPFTYDRNRRRYDVKKRSIKYKIWFILMLIGMFAEWAQVTRELIRSKLDHTVSRGEWGLIYFVFASWNFICGCHYNTVRKANEIVNHMNQGIRMREYFTEDRLPPTKDHRFAQLHIYATVFQCFFQCLMVAVEGMTKAHYMFANVPAGYRNTVTYGMWAVWAYYRVLTNFMSAYFPIFAGLFHVSTCNQVVGYKEQARLPAAQKYHIYRMLQVLTSRYSEAHSMIFIPHFTIFIAQNLILGVYGTVKFAGHIEFANYMNFPLMSVLVIVMASTFYTKNSTVYEKTKDEKRGVLRRLLPPVERPNKKGRQERLLQQRPRHTAARFSSPGAVKEAKRMAKASPVVAVTFGSLYPIKRTTIMNLFNFIACNAISTLITYP